MARVERIHLPACVIGRVCQDELHLSMQVEATLFGICLNEIRHWDVVNTAERTHRLHDPVVDKLILLFTPCSRGFMTLSWSSILRIHREYIIFCLDYAGSKSEIAVVGHRFIGLLPFKTGYCGEWLSFFLVLFLRCFHFSYINGIFSIAHLIDINNCGTIVYIPYRCFCGCR